MQAATKIKRVSTTVKSLCASVFWLGLATPAVHAGSESPVVTPPVQQPGSQDNWSHAGRSLQIPADRQNYSRTSVVSSRNGIYSVSSQGAGYASEIERFYTDGNYWGTVPGTFGGLIGLASSQGSQRLYALDITGSNPWTSKVIVFQDYGGYNNVQSNWGSEGASDPQLRSVDTDASQAIAVDNDGMVYIADAGNACVKVFDNWGTFQRKFGEPGSAHPVGNPTAVAVNAKGEIFVAGGSLVAGAGLNGLDKVVGSNVKIFKFRNVLVPGTFTAGNYTPDTTVTQFVCDSGSLTTNSQAFALTPDGRLFSGYWNLPVGGATQGAVCTQWNPETLTPLDPPSYIKGGLYLPASVAPAVSAGKNSRGLAFDASGNGWLCAGNNVLCFERRMRFDAYQPSKTVPQPSILSISQTPGSYGVDIWYSLLGSGNLDVAVVGFVDGSHNWDKVVVAGNVTHTNQWNNPLGSGGSLNVSLDSGYATVVKSSWNLPADLPSTPTANMTFAVLAKDERPAIGVHFVTIPAGGTLASALTVSTKPIGEEDLRDFYLWLVARQDPRVTRSGNSVVLTASGTAFATGMPVPYAGVSGAANVLHNGTSATSLGVAFAAKAIGVRPITAQERDILQGGSYVSSVGPSSVVLQLFANIPGGTYRIGDQSGDSLWDAPSTSVTLSAYSMAVNDTTYAQWNTVREWASQHGYYDLSWGAGKAPNHPVQSVSWYDVVKWCNAASERDGLTPCYIVTDAGVSGVYRSGNRDDVVCNWTANGYRLPTEAEWEVAARGGLTGQRFPWGNTISQGRANYYGMSYNYGYDQGPNGYNFLGTSGGSPYTTPVGSFSPNGYGLYDMAGNVSQWCWDLKGVYSDGVLDPKGGTYGMFRVYRGGSYDFQAPSVQCAQRNGDSPGSSSNAIGFRLARKGAQ